ncbi:hypothetical protein FNF27_04971 [Cafeteria roenbergensis]|uniref:FAD-binding PCMH-type domain-containing protein n=1 Tax=Cafeteria roenbergensis TaxID=33653 RepID=A0A5A8EAB0_CAFRO|nr:hypothetical protein FNF27_04971 [Cafeteria roenbergensis]
MLAAAAAAALLVFRVVVVHPQWVRRPGLPSATWDGVIAFRPAAVVRAATVQDVEDAVRAAVSSGTTLKALGSGHSWSGAADPTGGTALSMDAVDAIAVEKRFADGSALVRAGGGARLYQVFRFLEEHGFSLPNVPSVDAQSMGGVLATACHGSGAASQGLASSVEGVGFIAANGTDGPERVEAWKEHLVEWRELVTRSRASSHGRAAPASLWGAEALASATDSLSKQGVEDAAGRASAARRRALVFDAARAHLGALGVVFWVSLRVEPAFFLRSHEWLARTDDVFAASKDVAAASLPVPPKALGWPSAAAFLDECVRGAGGARAACASRFVDAGIAPAVPAHAKCLSVRCLSSRHEFLKLWVLPHTPFTVVHAIDRVSADEAGPAPHASISGWRRALDEVQADLLDLSLFLGATFPSLQPWLNLLAAAAFSSPRTRLAPAHSLQVIPFRVPFHTETEWSVPARHTSRLFRSLQAAMDEMGVASGFVQEWRMVAPDDVLASPDQEDAAVGAEPRVHVTLGLRAPNSTGMGDGYFGALERLATPLGGRPHWAKRIGFSPHSSSPAQLQQLYPSGQLQAFAEAAAILDPRGIFRNAWLDAVVERVAV